MFRFIYGLSGYLFISIILSFTHLKTGFTLPPTLSHSSPLPFNCFLLLPPSVNHIPNSFGGGGGGGQFLSQLTSKFFNLFSYFLQKYFDICQKKSYKFDKELI